jgi:hypothetical protein
MKKNPSNNSDNQGYYNAFQNFVGAFICTCGERHPKLILFLFYLSLALIWFLGVLFGYDLGQSVFQKRLYSFANSGEFRCSEMSERLGTRQGCRKFYKRFFWQIANRSRVNALFNRIIDGFDFYPSLSNALRVSRAATFPKCASIRSVSHNRFSRRYQTAKRRRTARAC